MKKLVLGALMVVMAVTVVACSKDKTPIKIIDSGSNGGDDAIDGCNVQAQSGCNTNEKCTWIRDSSVPGMLLGHIGCAPQGGMAVGASCMYGPDGATGYDDCVGGSVCQQGRCKAVCDLNGGTPMCATDFSCARYEGLFANPGTAADIGVCDPNCDPLADNDFDGSGSAVPSGSACPDNGSQSIGCYGFASDSPPTRWSCTRQVNIDVVHRTQCTTANGCANAAGNPYINGCAQGYLPALIEMTGSMQVVCVALCAPGNTYLANLGTQAPAGLAPHRCNNNDARGNFDPATAGATPNNGDHCMYSWLFELDADGNLVRSRTSDTVGYCLNHKFYRYDSNGDGNVDMTDANWPACSTLPDGFGTGSAVGAADFGCVDTMHAGFPFNGKAGIKRRAIQLPRFPYHNLISQ